MERKEFLRSLGLVGLVTPLLSACKDDDVTPADTTSATTTSSTTVDTSTTPASCTVGDTETDGPYPLYSSRGSSIQRVDITDGKTGVPLNITIVVRNVKDNCNIVANARVDIWHCDKDGYYSGYSNSGYLGTQNNSSAVFCRGIQYTDTTGLAKFLSIYPGWYNGRVTHIHAQIYVGTSLKLTTQIAFPEEINTEVYKTALYVTHGQNSTKNTSDNIIKDSLDNELATVIANDNGGYDLTHTIYISA